MGSLEECRSASAPSPTLAAGTSSSTYGVVLPSAKPLGRLGAGKAGKKRQVNKFYRQQCSLLESFEADSKTVADFQNFKQRTKRNSVDEESANGPSEANGGLLKKVVLFSEPEDDEDDEKDELTQSAAQVLLAGCDGPPQSKQSDHEPLRPLDSGGSSRLTTDSQHRAMRRLALVTLAVNLLLTVAKAIASYLSGSLSIISSLVDSLVDITSGLVIWLTSRAIRKHDPYLYPVGRTRLEPLALVIVSVIMGVASVQMTVKSVESVLAGHIDPHVDLPTLVIMVTTVVVKFVLFILCNRYQNDPSTRVLAQDHRNDCLSNSIALICAYSAQKLWVYLDPIGAVFVAIYIAVTWYRTGREQLLMLSGRSAPPDLINRIIKVCIDHDERINYMDTVYVYHFGTRFLVEVHIVLDQDMRLKEAHDISEALQLNIESLPEVERAFVHVDYEFFHKPEDEHKHP